MNQKQTRADRLVSFLEATPNSTIAAIAYACDMSTNSASAVISQINADRVDAHKGCRIVGAKMAGSSSFAYALAKSDAADTDPQKKASPELPRQIAVVPTMEQATAQLAQCIVGSMRAEIDQMLAGIVRQAVEEGVGGMMQGIRGALASAFSNPAEPAPVAKVVEPDDIKLPATVSKNTSAIDAMVAENAAVAHAPATASQVTNILSTRTKHREKTRPQPAAAAQVAETTDRKPKVVIAGLHANKQEFIRREFRDCFDLRIFNPDQLRAIQDGTVAGDVAFLMADFVSHKHQDALEAAGAKIIVVHGGISSLREAMTSHYVEKVAA